MKNARLLTLLLVAVIVLVDLVALSVVASYSPPHWPDPALIVFFSLAMSQVSLVAVWAGFGGKSLPWRVMGLVLTAVLWGRLVAWIIDPSEVNEHATIWTLLLLAQAAAILSPLFAARLRGVKLVRAASGDCIEQTTGLRPRLQFSLGYLLSWITVLAVVLGIVQYTVDYRFLPGDREDWQARAVLSLDNAALALAALWTVLGTRWPLLRPLALAVATAAAIAAGTAFLRMDGIWPYASLCLLEGLWLLATLWVFRVAGYRVVRRAAVRSEEPLSPEVG